MNIKEIRQRVKACVDNSNLALALSKLPNVETELLAENLRNVITEANRALELIDLKDGDTRKSCLVPQNVIIISVDEFNAIQGSSMILVTDSSNRVVKRWGTNPMPIVGTDLYQVGEQGSFILCLKEADYQQLILEPQR